LVAVISNGSAILGLGNLGALASKPVMEGKAVLFKRFADINAIDLEIDSSDPNEIINSITKFGKSFGGINLEDIAAPNCFIIEQKLKETLDIPVFHDDQHGTAITTLAGLINALDISGKSIKDIKVVVNGAGASAIACTNLFKVSGIPNENIIMLDSKGVLYRGRDNLDQWKSAHAIDTIVRTLAEAIVGADVFLGLSKKNILTKDMVKKMAKNPIIFACANPDPEIKPEDVYEVRDDAIVATGRSDYPNQVNNVIGFPYIFRGALDVRAKTINEEMKIAAAHAIASLAREDVPDEVAAAMGGERPRYGKEYIIPSTFDPRLISVIPAAVAKAAMKSGVARKEIKDFEIYKDQLKQRLDPSVTIMQGINSQIKKTQKRVVFAEGEDENTLKAAIAFKNSGLGTPILVAKKEKVKERLREIGLDENSIPHFVDILQKLSKLTVEKEAELTEINPLVILKDGSMMALDGKVMTDDNSNFRHKELAKYHERTELEKKAEESGFSLVELDGNIAVIGNGAGLVMSTLDMLTDNGGKAACFLDVGGTATEESVYEALTLISKMKKVKAFW